MTAVLTEDVVGRLAIEYWRLLRAFERSCGVGQGASNREAAQARYAASKLSSILGEIDMRLVIFDGERFEAGLPVSAINADEFEGEDDLVIAATIEPAVIVRGDVKIMGRVLLEQRAVEGGD